MSRFGWVLFLLNLVIWWCSGICTWLIPGTSEHWLLWIADTAGHWRLQFLLVSTIGVITIAASGARSVLVLALWLLTAGWCVGELASHGRGVSPEAGSADLRLFVFNGNSLNESIDEIVAEIERADPDIAVVCEMSANFVRPYYREGPGEMKHVAVRAPIPGTTAWVMVLSRWPLHTISEDEDPYIHVRVDAPFGGFELVGLHLPSPRSHGRWSRGVRIVRELDRPDQGVPMLLAGDFNGSPWGVRDRDAREVLGMRRAKPVLTFDGTFPSALPWPGRIPIDGVWVDGSWRVVSWEVGSPAGSDHAPVIVELEAGSRVDRPSDGADTRGGREPGGRSG